ncbi:MAG: hypothetical protein CO092_00035 [Candidatus Aenigmarchaeota archaeon CG_4_9_14_3_um_filter_37_18]|nr:MAG: hypothetical protein AUJ50_02905 [Candidatus Aenigmarchaeota archaeon CG1_02_38_14]PIW41480.1 MAG: hypothetical protein COW21_01600 [Candidatus Aenigmarchaeota archaeon CG15_BIG_FIL_POST_REV_8_21_14_020_37_27]PIY35201.1 MAG: hypothetical protein COZ04_04175 [Candidatus Aenigmarchaeota archaeon CG_4_10_14_3_um_filter_37_21]PJB76122.1 MAG: hypothetical protein CO092_00035 [Candidatus Aenigmarchaeota archaeon CG_4_9_14_3_um_filter_37_18]
MVFKFKFIKRRFTSLEKNRVGVNMLTKEQLILMARRNGLPLFTQERDYFQMMFLSRLYSQKNQLVFKGGTCLKLAYNLPRFSEDLDFICLNRSKALKSLLEKVLDELKLIGINGKLTNEKIAKSSAGYKVVYQGPLYTGKTISKGGIRIDVSFRKDMVLKPELMSITSEYPDIQPFLAYCMPMEEIFAEKVRALIKRSKPRDIYDVWFLINRNVKIDRKLIIKKINLQGLKFDLKKLENEIGDKRKDWKSDLSTLLSTIPDFDAVKNNIIKKLKEALDS